ncbi:MAG: DUF411 domain-containing protein [Alphaproteobacteria bacterium]|nr:DUF411 domain-containing protein [Alphaproteobacteria bacterium]
MRRILFASFLALFAVPAFAGEPATLYKDPNCGCCTEYANILKTQGFDVTIKETTSLEALRRMAGVPDKMASCHTMMIGGYVVEGHVPVAAVRKLLAEKPAIRGISLPGMPLGSPGMNGPKEGPFVVYEIGAKDAKSGGPKVFMVE